MYRLHIKLQCRRVSTIKPDFLFFSAVYSAEDRWFARLQRLSENPVIWIQLLTEAHLLLLLFSWFNLSLSLSQGRRKNQKGKRKTARVREKRARKASAESASKMERKDRDGERGALIWACKTKCQNCVPLFVILSSQHVCHTHTTHNKYTHTHSD